MDHQSAVDFARWLMTKPAAEARWLMTKPAAEAPDSVEHDHAGHEHEHSHSHDAHDSATCTDPTHDHSHDSADRQLTTAAKRFGIRTFVYTARRPFIASRFEKLLHALPFARLVPPAKPAALAWLKGDGSASAAGRAGPFQSVMRSKGFVWLADDGVIAYYWSQAGKQLELSAMGRWWAAVPRSSWPEAHVGSILADCEGEWGDRRQELIFIGANLAEAEIIAALDACLATDAELSELGKARGAPAAPKF